MTGRGKQVVMHCEFAGKENRKDNMSICRERFKKVGHEMVI